MCFFSKSIPEPWLAACVDKTALLYVVPYLFITPVVHRNYMFLFSSKEYSSYPSFPQSQYSQYYSSSYNSPYMSTNSISPSAIPTSTYSLQESSHNITSQSTESLSGRCISSVLSFAVPAICRHKHCNLVVGI